MANLKTAHNHRKCNTTLFSGSNMPVTVTWVLDISVKSQFLGLSLLQKTQILLHQAQIAQLGLSASPYLNYSRILEGPKTIMPKQHPRTTV
jgi:hypothetical protein